MTDPTWDILIPSTWGRTEKLNRLLLTLEPQMVDGVQAVVSRDNLEIGLGPKRQRMVDASEAEYISFIDDDDLVASNYVSAIRRALLNRPDVVGFRMQWIFNGKSSSPETLRTSLDPTGIARPPFNVSGLGHLNPIRREIALTGQFYGDESNEEGRWWEGVHKAGMVQTESYVDNTMYFVHREGTDNFRTHAPVDEEPPAPQFDFVRYVVDGNKLNI